MEITINTEQGRIAAVSLFSVLTYGLYSLLALSCEWQVLAWFYLYNGTSSAHTHLQETQSKILIVGLSKEVEKTWQEEANQRSSGNTFILLGYEKNTGLESEHDVASKENK